MQRTPEDTAAVDCTPAPACAQTRIALLGTLPPVRGLSSYCRELALSLAQDLPVRFLGFKHLYPKRLYPGGKDLEDASLPLARHPNLRLGWQLNWYNPLSWALAGLSTQAELLHAQWWSLPLAPAYALVCLGFRLRRKPIVFTVHNVLPHEASTAFRRISRALFALGDRFIVHTRIGRAQLEAHYGIDPSRVHVIPHGLLGFQVRKGINRAQVRQELGIGGQEKVLLLFGAIRPYKGLDTALRAFAGIARQHPSARLLIAGKPWGSWGPYRRLIDELGIEPRRLSLHLDYVPSDQVHRFFEAADVTILPYQHFDSQSGVGATALAFGKPLIVSDVGGLPDLVSDRRFVVPPGDARALSRALQAALGNPETLAAMAQDARRMAERFSWSTIARQTQAVYGLCVRSDARRLQTAPRQALSERKGS